MTSKHKRIEPGCNTLAEIAAAYERAAEMCDRYPYVEGVKTAIRALATPEQTAALDAVKVEAREQGMREAAAVCSGMADNAFTELAKEHTVQCSEAILAAITKGDKV